MIYESVESDNRNGLQVFPQYDYDRLPVTNCDDTFPYILDFSTPRKERKNNQPFYRGLKKYRKP